MSGLVSVYIPTHNRVKLLRRAVESVLRQEYDNFEIIIVDDASQDDTPNYLYELSKKDPRVKFFRQEISKGACAARNLAIRNSNGDIVTGLDDDDEFLPNRLEMLMSIYDEKYSFVSTSWQMVPTSMRRRIRERFIYRHGLISLEQLLSINHVGNQIMVEKEKILELGGFDESLPAWQDYDMWVRLVHGFGRSYKSNVKTILIHDDEGIGDRITTSPKRKLGMQMFFDKHKSKLSKFQQNKIQSLIAKS